MKAIIEVIVQQDGKLHRFSLPVLSGLTREEIKSNSLFNQKLIYPPPEEMITGLWDTKQDAVSCWWHFTNEDSDAPITISLLKETLIK